MHVFLRYISEIVINTSNFRDTTFSVSVFFEFHRYINIITVHWIVFVIHMLETQIKYSQLSYWSKNVSIANVTVQRQFSHPTKQSGIASSKTRISEARPSSLTCTLKYMFSGEYLHEAINISAMSFAFPFPGIIEGTTQDQ